MEEIEGMNGLFKELCVSEGRFRRKNPTHPNRPHKIGIYKDNIKLLRGKELHNIIRDYYKAGIRED